MKKINLTQGKIALVDDEDFRKVSSYNWTATKKGSTWYAITNINNGEKRTTIYIHQIIMNHKQGDNADHIDHDGLNNQRKNLRKCSKAENNHNRLKRKATSSIYKGVCFAPKLNPRNPYLARIKVDGKDKHLGCFDSEEVAAKVYDRAAQKYFGDFAQINF
jgi:hypothetical protein